MSPHSTGKHLGLYAVHGPLPCIWACTLSFTALFDFGVTLTWAKSQRLSLHVNKKKILCVSGRNVPRRGHTWRFYSININHDPPLSDSLPEVIAPGDQMKHAIHIFSDSIMHKHYIQYLWPPMDYGFLSPLNYSQCVTFQSNVEKSAVYINSTCYISHSSFFNRCFISFGLFLICSLS